MGLALRLNFVDVVCDDSLKNFWANGKKIGYQFDVRLSYYRGHFLSTPMQSWVPALSTMWM